VTPLLCDKSAENGYQSEVRTYPLDLIHPVEIPTAVSLTLLAGDESESVSEKTSVSVIIKVPVIIVS
jgi:hypothetical protein